MSHAAVIHLAFPVFFFATLHLVALVSRSQPTEGHSSSITVSDFLPGCLRQQRLAGSMHVGLLIQTFSLLGDSRVAALPTSVA